MILCFLIQATNQRYESLHKVRLIKSYDLNLAIKQVQIAFISFFLRTAQLTQSDLQHGRRQSAQKVIAGFLNMTIKLCTWRYLVPSMLQVRLRHTRRSPQPKLSFFTTRWHRYRKTKQQQFNYRYDLLIYYCLYDFDSAWYLKWKYSVKLLN